MPTNDDGIYVDATDELLAEEGVPMETMSAVLK